MAAMVVEMACNYLWLAISKNNADLLCTQEYTNDISVNCFYIFHQLHLMFPGLNDLTADIWCVLDLSVSQ